MSRWWFKYRLRRRQYAWGGSKWTMPIPIHPRVQGNFHAWSWRVWTPCEVIGQRLLTADDQIGVRIVAPNVSLRADRSGKWAEVKQGW